MRGASVRHHSSGPAALPTSLPDAAALARRRVQRVAAELVAGTPVVLTGKGSEVLLAAETAGVRGIAEFKAVAAGAGVILLTPARGAALLDGDAVKQEQAGAEAIALVLDHVPLTPEVLLGLADPTLGTPLPAGVAMVPPPASAPAALALVKSAHLLPAALLSPVAAGARRSALSRGLLSLPLADLEVAAGRPAFALRRMAEARVSLDAALDARVIAFRAAERGAEQLAILIGEPETRDAPLVRVHSACFTGDVLGSLRCDCGAQLRGAIGRIAAEGAGAVLYLAEEGRGIGLMNKLRAYRLQDAGLDTLEANRALGWGGDERNFLAAAAMLRALGLTRVRLLTNSPDKLQRLTAAGITIVGREPLAFPPNGVNDRYLATKAKRLGHLLS
ncbi:MAG: GTP cyclohydrolase II [Acetobacteraceae bacterium]